MTPEQARNQHCEEILDRMDAWKHGYTGKGSATFQGSINQAFLIAQQVGDNYVSKILPTQGQINFTENEEKELMTAQSSFRNAVESALNFPQTGDKIIRTELKITAQKLNERAKQEKLEPITVKESAVSKLMNTMKAAVGSNKENGPGNKLR